MAPPEFDAGVHEKLGALGANVNRIIADQELARSDRKQQYSKLEDMVRRLDDVDSRLATMDARLKEMEPIAADIGKWRERFIGMRILVVVASAGFGGLFVMVGKWILVKFGWG